MSFVINPGGEVALVAIRGKFLGSIEAPAFKSAIDDLKRRACRHVVVDLSAVDFMDSTGIGTLVGALTTLRREDGDLCLARIDPRVRRIFAITGLLGPVFREYASVEEATAGFALHDTAAGA